MKKKKPTKEEELTASFQRIENIGEFVAKQEESRDKPRMICLLSLYHQPACCNDQPTVVESRTALVSRKDMLDDPYSKRMKATKERQPLPLAHLASNVGVLCILNLHKLKEIDVDLRLYSVNLYNDNGKSLIYPGMPHVSCPCGHLEIALDPQCPIEEIEVRIHVFPEYNANV